ncbi:hypothetical protein BFP72_09895 [Reichenbachiella sp. 5M10]|nr:hypothetical protein BFP72_09895 [Reichenbachiella sp. 5M10]
MEIDQLNHVLLYDGVCKFCNSSVNFVLEHEKNDQLKFAQLQSPLGVRILEAYGYPKDYAESILYLSAGQLQSKSKAALRISGYLRRPWSWLQVFGVLPGGLTDCMYGIIARNRYKWFGKADACILPPPNHRERFLE